MKVNYPTTQDGWVKLGELISEKNATPGTDAPVSKADADTEKIGKLSIESAKEFATAQQLHRDAEVGTESGTKLLTKMQGEIRRVARVLSGRYRSNMKEMGKWGFEIDESTVDQKEEETDGAEK